LGAQPTDRKIKAGHLTLNQERKNIMKTRYSGKSFKDSSTMKKAKLSILEKRKIKREKKKK